MTRSAIDWVRPGKGGGGGVVTFQHFRVRNSSDWPDTIECRAWNFKTQEEGDSLIQVAKPWDLRRSTSHGRTMPDGVGYTFSGNLTRTATKGAVSETQIVTPPYLVDTVEGPASLCSVILAARGIRGGTGALADGKPVEWQELSARAFAAQASGTLIADPTTAGITVGNSQNNFGAQRDPGPDDGVVFGWGVGSQWINVLTGGWFVCVDPAIGAAVWRELGAGGGGSGDVVGSASSVVGQLAAASATDGKHIDFPANTPRVLSYGLRIDQLDAEDELAFGSADAAWIFLRNSVSFALAIGNQIGPVTINGLGGVQLGEFPGGNEILIAATVTSAVNEVTITNAKTGDPALIAASGEANAGLKILPKAGGTGTVEIVKLVAASPTFTGAVTVPSPTAGSDAANKDYADALANGLDWKLSVRVATTAAGTLATDFENGDTIDGVVLATGDRILIKNQAAGAENGIYVVAASGVPARSVDANVSAEVTSGMACLVSEGTANADKVFVLTTNDPITLGTTALVFAQLAGGSYTHPNHTGDVTSVGDGAQTIANDAVTNSKAANVAVNTIKGRITAGTGDPEDLSAANVRTIINVADGANAYVHPNHSGDVTSVADGAQTIANDAVSNAKLANMATATVKGRNTAGTGDPEDLATIPTGTVPAFTGDVTTPGGSLVMTSPGAALFLAMAFGAI